MIKAGDFMIQKTITDKKDNQFLYIERIYVILTVDELKKQITAVNSIDWICGYQRDSAHDYNDLRNDGYSIEILKFADVTRSGIYKKLDSNVYQNIGREYSWIAKDGKEISVCVPYIHVVSDYRSFSTYNITSYNDDFSAAMEVYPDGNDVYVFGKRSERIILSSCNVEKNIYISHDEKPNK